MRALVLLSLAACGASSARNELRVVDFHPIEITFDRPVGGPIEARLSPDVPARAWWRDDATLVIEPSVPLRPSTRYEVALTGDLGARTHGYHVSFINRPLAVEGVWGVDADALGHPGTSSPSGPAKARGPRTHRTRPSGAKTSSAYGIGPLGFSC